MRGKEENPGALGAAGARARSRANSPVNIESVPPAQVSPPPPVYLARLQFQRGNGNEIARLRLALKFLLRVYGLRCISIRGDSPMTESRSYQHDSVVTAPIARIVPERDGGWLVLTHRGHGWLCGDRRSAIREKQWLDQQWRGRS